MERKMEFNEAWNNACSNVGLACREGNYVLLEHLLSRKRPVDVQDNRGWRPIHEAASNNQARCLKLLLKQKKTNVNWKSFEGETPLMLAAQHGHSEIMRLLLSKGADPNARNNEDESPLMVAAKLQNLSCVRHLLDGGADVSQQSFDGSTALHLCIIADCSDISVVEELVARGALLDSQDCCGITPVFQAARVGCLAALKVLLERAKEKGHLRSVVDMGAQDGATPVFIATQNGFDQCVDLLLQNGADCNRLTTDRVSALHLAIQFGHSNCARLLLDKMDNSIWQHYTKDKFSTFTDVDNVIGSPLHSAIFWDRSDMLRLVLNSGVNPNTVFDYVMRYLNPRDIHFFRTNMFDPSTFSSFLPQLLTPLGVAALKRRDENITDLLLAGAQINPKADHVMCPLLGAVFAGSVYHVEHLLSFGADPNCSGRCSRNFLSRILIWPMLTAEMLRVLLKHGADARPALGHGSGALHIENFEMMEVNVITFQERHYRTVAVLQEFLSPSILEQYTSAVFRIVNDLDPDDKLCWQKVLETSRNPPALCHLCRWKIRECLMDNGSNVFPFARRLERLPHMPPLVARYLAYS